MIPRLPKGFSHPVPLGGGGFATVYRARHTALDRLVAVKIIREGDKDARERLLNEARTQARLSIEHIPQVYDAFEWRDQVCIVMQWIQGSSLTTLLRHKITGKQRLALADRIVKALAGLHAKGYAHRDFKPGNIVVSPDQGIFLIDFGFTKNVIDGERSASGVVKGTPAYMAPELWRSDGGADPMRADVFSLGLVLRELLGHQTPLSVAKQCRDEEPGKRPASAAEALDIWERQLHDNGIEPVWEPIAQPYAAQALAAKLYSAARELFFRGRTDEAYWLLAESLEHDPDMPEALEFMQAFPRLSRSRQRRKVAIYASAAAAVVATVIVAILVVAEDRGAAMRHRGQRERENVRDLFIKDGARRRGVQADGLQLRRHSQPHRQLTGELIVASYPTGGTFLIDGESAAMGAEGSAGFTLEFGTHLLQWVDKNGQTLWQEHVQLLPFQRLALSVRPR